MHSVRFDSLGRDQGRLIAMQFALLPAGLFGGGLGPFFDFTLTFGVSIPVLCDGNSP
jgi:hypothetical protein